ncbi:MAG TPA: glycoside hydrolase family 15 protein [Methylocella sp.]
MSPRIEDYGLIGNCQTAALVSPDGSVDWLCLPRFDSAACFAALLGTPDNGRWEIAPADPSPRITRQYRDSTLILETTFETEHGTATLIDFMPLSDGTSDLVRLVVGQHGRLDFRTELVIRFDCGISVPWVSQLEDENGLEAVTGPDILVLRTPVALHGEDLRTIGEFSVAAGETVPFVLSHGASYRPRPSAVDPQVALAQTETFWRDWSARCPPVGPWSEAVKRSLLTLKALTYGPTGGIVAAATTSLPEQIGGPRNWDYRYCWLRDASFTLLALMNLGYYDEARAWRDWLLRAVAGSPQQVQILYGITGEKQLPERELPWLAGYEGSRPVRIGNSAVGQRQLDIYGEVINTGFELVRGGMQPLQRGADMRRVALEHLETIWREPDEGIWEVRGGPRHFTHSKVMAWVAFDRAAIMAEDSGDTSTSMRWRQIADEIHGEVCRSGFDRELGSFVQFYGSRRLDASLLQIPLFRFLPASDRRVRGTLAAIEQRLVRDGGLVMRYDTADGVDGLPPGEGAFLACSFWLVDNYILQQRFDDARVLFERLLALQNDLGLLAEEYDPRARRMLGNFPQAFSHVGLINTAINLASVQGSAAMGLQPSQG